MRKALIASAVLFLSLTGCASMSPVVGTWSAKGASNDAPFTFGSVSFVGDKTFTAEAKYGGESRVQSGSWSIEGDQLMLNAGSTKRQYTYKMQDGDLVVTEPKSGHSVTLERTRS
jgi:hypothetical protein